MNILLLTKEYPPHIYGGAGVHVDYLGREIVRLEGGRHRLQVLCFGEQNIQDGNLNVKGISGRADLHPGKPVHASLLDTLGRNLAMSGLACEADVVHCHTWYTYLAGCLIKELLQIPLVITTHSLEPHRPWKREQLGTGYDVSSWLEEAAVRAADGIIAVSSAMQADTGRLYGTSQEKIRVIHNGIDPDQYSPMLNAGVLSHYGIQPAKPYILFVGRITRQKGVIHLVRAIPQVDEGVQIVLCAGAPDTEVIAREMKEAVARAGEQCGHPIVWIRKMIPRGDLVVLYSHAELFVCPSVYEPFGIINLEAMACQTPVVASAVGGIPEVVVHGETGLLVPFDPLGEGNAEPLEPERYARDLAGAINDLLRAPAKRKSMGLAARQRVEAHFSWNAIARKTVAYYQEVCGRTAKPAPGVP